MSSSAHSGGTNNGDWFELTNTGLTAVDITGWSWDDADNLPDQGNFGSITSIAAGESIIIVDETDATVWRSNWGISGSVQVAAIGSGLFQAFAAGGDTINIFDSTDVSVLSFSFGAAGPSGFSLEWNTTGASLGNSVLGENGAFRAVSNGQTSGLGAGVDIGSPGLAVPEPGFVALAGLGALGLLSRRRRK